MPIILLALGLSGCAAPGGSPTDQQILLKVDLDDSAGLSFSNRPVRLSAAGNETVAFTISVSDLADAGDYSLRFGAFQHSTGAGSIDPEQFRVYQLLSMPAEINRADYVRHTGRRVGRYDLPRALLPLRLNDGTIDLAQVSTAEEAVTPLILWVDLKVPAGTPAGQYRAELELIGPRRHHNPATLSAALSVHDFDLPDTRHLLMVSRLSWESLLLHYPDRFENVTPRLLNRVEPRYAPAIETLDQLITLAQRHRTQVVVPRIQPTVKWPAGREPRIDWSDFYGVVAPWLNGTGFDDAAALGYWPLPAVDYLDQYDDDSRQQYWSAAARYFDRHDWLTRSSIILDAPASDHTDSGQRTELTQEIARLLAAHPRIRVTVPLEEDQIDLSRGNPALKIDPAAAPRLLTVAPGLVTVPPARPWPDDVARPHRWLRTDTADLTPYTGADGAEHDIRLVAALAFLRQAHFILWDDPLPEHDQPGRPARPDRIVWFYPGNWFGLDEPVPTVQLKWLRRAQQDYEYLRLAGLAGDDLDPVLIARLLTRPVEIQLHQDRDPAFALMSGTSDRRAWEEARGLLGRMIALDQGTRRGDAASAQQAGMNVSDSREAVRIDALDWLEPYERPLLIGRELRWYHDPPGEDSSGDGQLALRLGVDIYNASDETPDSNAIWWSRVPYGWRVSTDPVRVPPLATYRVHRFWIDAHFDLDDLVAGANPAPIELRFTHGFTGRDTPLRLMAPVAASDRRRDPIDVDGALDEWHPEDAIQRGAPLIRMLNRPALQRQRLEPAQEPAFLYTAWTDDDFCLAFQLAGMTDADRSFARNFVEYDARRAWGEDLAQVLIQGIYDDNSLGPVLHLVCKPNGHWVERRHGTDPVLPGAPALHEQRPLSRERARAFFRQASGDEWRPLEGAAIRYASRLVGDEWRGEVAIPWALLDDDERGRPRLLRFNFIQHHDETGQSASWAGPIDFGRDHDFMGILYLREPQIPGMKE